MADSSLRKSMILDGIAASEAIDSSGEILDVKGLDIRSLQDGTGVLNYEHRGDQSEGASANDIIGSITYAKKIFSADDCDNDRELKYWNEVQLPFVYIQAELFNDEGHPGAQAAASLIRYYERRKMPILMRYSIEGSTLEREGNKLKRAVAKRVAATIKPCNRSCVSGVLSDDKTPEASKDELADLIRHERPNRRKLGSYEGEFSPIVQDPLDRMRAAVETLHEINDLNKALSAGGFNAAPTTLTGGSALQVEHVDGDKKKRFIKNQALAALRDWRGRGDLRTFLKHRLPDTSPEFLDHFTQLVEDYHLKKTIELEDHLYSVLSKKDGEPKSKAPKSSGIEIIAPPEDDEEELDPKDNRPLTIRGKSIRPLTALDSTHFDERKGVLFTPRGSFKLYLPQHDKFPGALESFHNILNDPKATAFHDYATKNWMKLHKLLKKGKVPPEVIMHSVLFSQLSPNTPVPMQELMYSHLVDSMKDKGVDARDPKFAGIKRDWVGRDSPTKFPDHAQDYFEGQGRAGVTLKNKSKTTGRKPGDIGSFMLANNKFKNMAQYHTLHEPLVELFGRHREDARGAVEELMQHKYKAMLWDARRKRAKETGKPDPGPYSEGPSVPGLAPKTGRYMAAMIGGGNVHVPDTHFARYLFGLEKGTDGRSIQYLKNTLWNENNSHVLNGIDRFYAAHHPAVQHMMDHPVFGKQFATREDAIFPAFWKNWISIVAHERARKMKTYAYNATTDHRPFWDAISPYYKNELDSLSLVKSEEDLTARTAKLHATWAHKYGDVPAMMMYYAHIVPQLLRASQRKEDPITKMNRIADELRKSFEGESAPEQPLPQLPAIPPPDYDESKVVDWQGKKIIPGEVEIHAGPYKGSRIKLMGVAPNGGAFVQPEGTPPRLLEPEVFRKASRVIRDPREIHLSEFVDANKHMDPLFTKSFEQKALAHGIDFNAKQKSVKRGITAEFSPLTGWYYSATGKSGYVKPGWDIKKHNWADYDPVLGDDQNTYPLPKREVLFHNMAHDFFGLGQHVPNTALFSHPKTNEPMSVMERVPNGFHYEPDDDDGQESLANASKDGTLDKLHLMDMIMGNSDRHGGNYMLSKQAPYIHLIDNGLTLDYGNPFPGASYLKHNNFENGAGGDYRDVPVHPAAVDWLLGLNHTEFLKQLLRHGVPPSIAKVGFNRLQRAQLAALEGRTQNITPITHGALMRTVNNEALRELARQAQVHSTY